MAAFGRGWRCGAGLVVALLLPLGARVATGTSIDAARRPRAVAVDRLAARVPSINAARMQRAREAPAPGAPRRALLWAVALLATAFAAVAATRSGRGRRTSHPTRAPPDLRTV